MPGGVVWGGCRQCESIERRKLKVLGIKCLRNIDKIRNENARVQCVRRELCGRVER